MNTASLRIALNSLLGRCKACNGGGLDPIGNMPHVGVVVGKDLMHDMRSIPYKPRSQEAVRQHELKSSGKTERKRRQEGAAKNMQEAWAEMSSTRRVDMT